MKLTEEQKKEYHERGVLILKGVFSREFMEEALVAYEEMLERFAEECAIPIADYTHVINQIRDLWKQDQMYENFILKSVLPQIAAQLMNRPAARLLHDHLISKPMGNSGEVPWHQDYPYWPVDHNFGLSCWLAMDDVDDRSGALEIIPGSHLRGEEAPVDFLQGLRTEFYDHPDKVSLPVEKGDVVVLHSLTWHRTGPNTSLPNRRAYISLWIPPESRYAPLHADWHPVNYNISVEPGEFLNSDWFPVVGEISASQMAKYPAGRLKFHGPEVVDEDLSMFDASMTVRKRIQEMLKETGNTSQEALEDVHGHLFIAENRERFVQDLFRKELVQDPGAAAKCLHELAINAIAWRKHKARNIYNQSYVEFQDIFG